MHSSTCGKNNTDGWNLDQGLAAQYAAQAGLDPDLAADAGEEVWDVLKSLRDATGETDPKRQAKLVKRTKARLAKANLSRHGELVQHIEAKLLALQGRGGDSELAHLTPGEVIVPPQLQTPAVVQAIQQAAQNAGVDMARYTTGSQASSVNPDTGMAEYAIHSNLSCGDLTPMGLCLDPYFEEITVTGVGGSDESFYPGQNSYDGSGLSGTGLGGTGGVESGGGETYGPKQETQDPFEEVTVTTPGPERPKNPRQPWYTIDPTQFADANPTAKALEYFMQSQCLDGDMEACLNRGPVTPINPTEEEIATLQPVELEYRIDAIRGLISGFEVGEKISRPLPPWLRWSLNLPIAALQSELDQYLFACSGLSGCSP